MSQIFAFLDSKGFPPSLGLQGFVKQKWFLEWVLLPWQAKG